MKRVCAGSAAVAVAIAFTAAAFAAPAFAATRKPVTTNTAHHEKVMTLKQADKDKDGYISRGEADASPALSNQFAALDKNNDGKLSPQEYAKHK